MCVSCSSHAPAEYLSSLPLPQEDLSYSNSQRTNVNLFVDVLHSHFLVK